jgi:hypothetical protein
MDVILENLITCCSFYNFVDFSFDKALHKASSLAPPPSERELYQEFLKHARGQLCLHLATLVLKKAKKVILWNTTNILSCNFAFALREITNKLKIQRER